MHVCTQMVKSGPPHLGTVSGVREACPLRSVLGLWLPDISFFRIMWAAYCCHCSRRSSSVLQEASLHTFFT